MGHNAYIVLFPYVYILYKLNFTFTDELQLLKHFTIIIMLYSTRMCIYSCDDFLPTADCN